MANISATVGIPANGTMMGPGDGGGVVGPGDGGGVVEVSSSPLQTMNYSSIVMEHYTANQLTALRATTMLLSSLGLIGNLLVVLVILSRRRWRFANSMFVLNIAIANLFICAFTLPLMTRALFDIDWKPAPQFCQLSGFLDNTAFACSAWSLALGSIERFFLVVFPMKHRQLMKYQRAVMLSFLIWALSVCLSVLPILGWNTYVYSPLTFTCGIKTNLPGAHQYYFLVYLTIVLPGPLIISTLCYSYIIFYLRVHYTLKPQVVNRKVVAKKANNDDKPDNTDIFGSNISELWKSPKRRSKNIRVVLPMILISVAFLVCFLPTVIVGFDITVNPGTENGQPKLKMIEYFITNLVLLGNSAMNPIIFTMCSSKFRSSGRIVVQLLFERFVLILFYVIYVVYYSIVTFFKALGTYLSKFVTSLGSCNANCIKSVGKYDSLNDVVIKITLTNSNDAAAAAATDGGGSRVRRNRREMRCCDDEYLCCNDRGNPINVGNPAEMMDNSNRNKEVKNNEYEIELAKSITPDNRTSETVL